MSPGDAEGSAHRHNPQPLSALLQGQQGRRSGGRGPQSGPWPTAWGARDAAPRGWLRHPGFLSIRAGVHPMLHDATPLLARALRRPLHQSCGVLESALRCPLGDQGERFTGRMLARHRAHVLVSAPLLPAGPARSGGPWPPMVRTRTVLPSFPWVAQTAAPARQARFLGFWPSVSGSSPPPGWQ